MSTSYSFNKDGSTISALDDDDLFVTVINPTTTPTTRVITKADLVSDIRPDILPERYGVLWFPSDQIILPGDSSDPGRDSTYGHLLFDGALAEDVPITVMLPPDWKEETSLLPFVKWAKTTSATGNVRWRLDYAWWDEGAALGSATSDTETIATVSDGDTANQHARTNLDAITTTGKSIFDVLQCRLYRTANHADDTYNGDDARLLGFGLIYTVDDLGSVGQFDKDGV